MSVEADQDARLIAQSFLREHPNCFRLLSGDVLSLMVEGYILRRVLGALDAGHARGKDDANVIRRLRADVFNAANHLSAEPQGAPRETPCAETPAGLAETHRAVRLNLDQAHDRGAEHYGVREWDAPRETPPCCMLNRDGLTCDCAKARDAR